MASSCSRIHALAAYLDVRLFERRVRAVELTVPGNTLWLKLADGFRLIESAVREVHTLQAPAEIAVSAGPAIVAK